MKDSFQQRRVRTVAKVQALSSDEFVWFCTASLWVAAVGYLLATV